MKSDAEKLNPMPNVVMTLPDLGTGLNPPLSGEIGDDLDIAYIKTAVDLLTREFAETRATMTRNTWLYLVFGAVNFALTSMLAALVWAATR